jgi:RNA polymerase sigma-70 factor (ECF subfamily)
MMDEIPDGTLVERVLAGDVKSFEFLVERYTKRYSRFAIRMLGNSHDAEEALQDAFVRAFRSLSQCEDPARFGSWFHSILVNQCRTTASRRGKRDKRFLEDVEVADFPAPSTDRDSSDWRAEIELALQHLNPEQREAFILKHVEEMSYEEMSALTGENISTLKMRVKRACDKMRQRLEGVLQ